MVGRERRRRELLGDDDVMAVKEMCRGQGKGEWS